MNEFLKLEYEQCMALVKYYDERHHSLMKFTAGFSSGVPTLLLAIYSLGDKVVPMFWEVASFVLLVSTIGLASVLIAITQTRLYFVYPARQLNAVRREFLRTSAADFSDNQMYLDTNFNAFKWGSSHTVQQAIVALQIGLFAGLTSFALNATTPDRARNVCISSIAAVAVALAAFGASAIYLWRKSRLHPDKSVHQQGK